MLRFNETVIGTLMGRRKRFFMDVMINGEQVVAHIANTGSMLGLVVPGCQVLMTKTDDKKRTLPYSVQALKIDGTWVGVNTMLPNRLIKDSFSHPALSFLSSYPLIKSEVVYGKDNRSRIDFLLSDEQGKKSYVEVKSVTLKEGECALFPDTRSERALKHIDDLLYMKQQGHDAGLLFLVQRDDCQQFKPAQAIDKHYAERLKLAVHQGLWVRAVVARITPSDITLSHEIEVII